MRQYAITLRDGVCPITIVEAYGDEASYDQNGETVDFAIWAEDELVVTIPREHIAYVMIYPDKRDEVK